MASSSVSCDIACNDPTVPLSLTIKLDHQEIAHLTPIPEFYQFSHEFEDSVSHCEHLLEFELRGKLPEHTEVNEHGEIIRDVTVSITNRRFESVAIENARTPMHYYHDFNGSQTMIDDEFYGIMGCNGQVQLRFSTPIYLWLLENL